MIDTTKYTQLLIFKRHWALAVAVGLGVMAIIIPVALGLPPVYRATANLRVERQMGNSSLGAAMGGMDLRMQTIRQDILSRAQVIKLINDLDLYPSWRKELDLDVIVERVRKDIVIQPQTMPQPNGPQLILSFSVSYTGESAESAERAANAIAQFYVAQNGMLRTKSVSKVVTDLKLQVDDAEKRVNDATAKLQEYTNRNPNLLPDTVNRIGGELTRLTTQIGLKASQESALKTKISGLESQIAAELSRPVAAATALTPAQKLESLKQTRQSLRQKGLQPGHVDIINLDREIAQLEANLPPGPLPVTATAPSIVKTWEAQRADAQKELDQVQGELRELELRQSQYTAQLQNAPTRNPVYDGLQSDVRIARDGYDLIKKQYDATASAERTTRDADAEEFRIEDPARAPDKAYGPNRINLIILGVFLAFVAGIGAAILRDQLDTSFHTLDELRMFTQVPVLVSIPDIKTRQQQVRKSLVMTTAAILILGVLGAVGVGAYRYAQNHSGITRIVSR